MPYLKIINTSRGWKYKKNKKLQIEIERNLPFFCFLFDNNQSFLSKIMVENVTLRLNISHYISYVFYRFLKLLYLRFSALKIYISKLNWDF